MLNLSRFTINRSSPMLRSNYRTNRQTKAPYSIVAGWGDEFVSLSRLDGVSYAIFLDKVFGSGLCDEWGIPSHLKGKHKTQG
jgi:hypothetical protein